MKQIDQEDLPMEILIDFPVVPAWMPTSEALLCPRTSLRPPARLHHLNSS